MPYGSPEYDNEANATYTAGGQGPDVSSGDPTPMTFQVVMNNFSGRDEALADAAFQDLIDWIDSSPNFTCPGGSKTYGAFVPITVTP